MNHTGIRLEVPQALYNNLIKIQQGRRHADKRKTSLADIVIELCQCALPMYDQQGNCLLPADSAGTGQAYASVLEIRKGNELQEKEQYLTRWEKELLGQAHTLNRERTLLLQEREELDGLLRENDWKRIKESLLSEIGTFKMQVDRQNQIIEKLEKRYLQNQEKIIGKLETILRQTAPDLLKDTVLPLLPALVSGIGSFLTNQKVEKLNQTNNNSTNP